ncbi:hypothetical protein AKJ56_01795 [candidate division MSBL1 archaeon SCGC-AAA382N08]|uniref:Uncharacterized protein n=1 Tax=candidate division MSBL1 archaeon SCGC-AAA382N08 TaxID=1698285 RepID=A0A133VP07_9EURY|nr:hypothetical protein AKJ56_01795 [candidate division MSBL1 archaeon SCGC-AAA382N08]
MSDIYPLTIIKSRYQGVYSGTKYIAFNDYPRNITDAMSDDVTTATFFSNYPKEKMGKGNSPREAYRALEDKKSTD